MGKGRKRRRDLALAAGKSEGWVVSRTGHRSSAMVALYYREAKTVEELGLGWFAPLHEAIPELRELGAGGGKMRLVVVGGGKSG